MNVMQTNSAGDVSLDAIAVMAQAQNENIEHPEIIVEVWGCSEWAIMWCEELKKNISGCARWTSTTPCNKNC
jgi:hypothetical protein